MIYQDLETGFGVERLSDENLRLHYEEGIGRQAIKASILSGGELHISSNDRLVTNPKVYDAVERAYREWGLIK